jgi:hypothetical protein
MNYNISLECEVCKNKIRLKVYGGYENRNPFTYSCPECKITISGSLIWNENPENGFIKEFKCNNAKQCSKEGDESHLLQLATEFFTDKIKKIKRKDPTMFFSPFMMDNSSFELKQKKINLIQYITHYFEENMLITIRLWELYKNKNHKYLNRQLLFYEFVEPVPMGQILKVNYEETIVEVLYRPFIPFLTESGYNKRIIQLRSKLNYIKRNNLGEIKKLKRDLQEKITYSDENIIHLLKSFAEYYRYLWPIILSEIYQDNQIDTIKESKGILTSNFESLKNYYVEVFEILGSILPLFLGLQNISLRGSRNSFEEEVSKSFSKIRTIVDYDKKVTNKGNKVKYFDNENIFLNYFDVEKILDNSIRNSIGHHSYLYDSDNQLINFIDRGKNKNMYLIEFGSLLYKTFYATFAALEVIMFLKNIEDI